MHVFSVIFVNNYFLVRIKSKYNHWLKCFRPNSIFWIILYSTKQFSMNTLESLKKIFFLVQLITIIVSQDFGAQNTSYFVHYNTWILVCIFVSLNFHVMFVFNVFPKFNRSSGRKETNFTLKNTGASRPLLENSFWI